MGCVAQLADCKSLCKQCSFSSSTDPVNTPLCTKKSEKPFVSFMFHAVGISPFLTWDKGTLDCQWTHIHRQWVHWQSRTCSVSTDPTLSIQASSLPTRICFLQNRQSFSHHSLFFRTVSSEWLVAMLVSNWACITFYLHMFSLFIWIYHLKWISFHPQYKPINIGDMIHITLLACDVFTVMMHINLGWKHSRDYGLLWLLVAILLWKILIPLPSPIYNNTFCY